VPVQPSVDAVERERREYEKRQLELLSTNHPEQCGDPVLSSKGTKIAATPSCR
jgi:hypothetical protein